MIYYHITKERHLNSILTKGLIAGHRRGLTIARVKHKTIFVTNNITKIVQWQAGEKWCIKNRAVVLKVDVEGLNIRPVRYSDGATYTISDFEFEIEEKKIDPSRIKFEIKLYE